MRYESDVEEGKLIDGWRCYITDKLEVAGKGKPEIQDSQPAGYGVKVISERAKSVFESCGVHNVQYLSLIVDYKKYGGKRQYFILNILGSVKAVDLEKTEFDYDEDLNLYSPASWDTKIYIDAEKVGNLLIFRDETFLQVYVAEKLVKEIERQGLTGFGFRKLP